ncbi:MAG: hypothetical protein ACTSYA_03560 [Candidatus Kariarchaeaceae archaeon]
MPVETKAFSYSFNIVSQVTKDQTVTSTLGITGSGILGSTGYIQKYTRGTWRNIKTFVPQTGTNYIDVNVGSAIETITLRAKIEVFGGWDYSNIKTVQVTDLDVKFNTVTTVDVTKGDGFETYFTLKNNGGWIAFNYKIRLVSQTFYDYEPIIKTGSTYLSVGGTSSSITVAIDAKFSDVLDSSMKYALNVDDYDFALYIDDNLEDTNCNIVEVTNTGSCKTVFVAVLYDTVMDAYAQTTPCNEIAYWIENAVTNHVKVNNSGSFTEKQDGFEELMGLSFDTTYFAWGEYYTDGGDALGWQTNTEGLHIDIQSKLGLATPWNNNTFVNDIYIDDGDDIAYKCATNRHNHGYDMLIGLSGGFSGGIAISTKNRAVSGYMTSSNASLSYYWRLMVTLHEMSHLFGAKDGDFTNPASYDNIYPGHVMNQGEIGTYFLSDWFFTFQQLTIDTILNHDNGTPWMKFL